MLLLFKAYKPNLCALKNIYICTSHLAINYVTITLNHEFYLDLIASVIEIFYIKSNINLFNLRLMRTK